MEIRALSKTSRRRLALASLAAFLLLFSPLLSSCGGDGGGGGAGDDRAEVTAALRALPTWSQYARVVEEAVEVGDTATCDLEGSALCAWKPCSITENPEELLTFGSAPDVLYLGSLIQGDTYLRGLSTMEELPIRQRAPLTVAVDLVTGTSISRTVDNPDAASIQQAMSEIVAEAEASGASTSSDVHFEKTNAYTSEQTALSLGISFRYLGTRGQAAFAAETSRETRTVTAYFREVMYEAYMVRPQTPSGFFSDAFTKELWDEQVALGNIGPDNLPVYVSSIRYGRMLVYSMTANASMDTMRAAVQASYYGTASASAEVERVIEDENTEIKITAVGGDVDRVLAAIREGTLEAYFEEPVALTSATPLAYTLRSLADSELAAVSQTTEYSVLECGEPLPEVWLNRVEWDAAAYQSLGQCSNLSFFELETTAQNLMLSDEVNSDYSSASNINLGNRLTFQSANTGLPFTFYLRATASPNYRLVWRDDFAGGSPARAISIGNINDEENDDFWIVLEDIDLNTAIVGIGIDVGDNESASGEAIHVDNLGGATDTFAYPAYPVHSPGTTVFLGTISNSKLLGLGFNEGSGGDDIFVRDFRFYYLTWD